MTTSFSFPVKLHAQTNSTLIFSEYIEGSGYNKALEIYNGTGSAIDLSDYSVVHFNNGASQNPSDGKYVDAVQLDGTLQNGNVFVLANAAADQKILDVADLVGNNYFYNFNGDDALVLFKNYNKDTRQGTIVDSIGKVGQDPGSYWEGNQVKTQNATLIRKENILTGDQDLYDTFDPSVQWISLPQDTFSYLGSYQNVDPTEQQDTYTATVDHIVDGDTLYIKETILGTNKVRLLNIDTPETYHLSSYNTNLIKTDPDQSQKFHGEKAKEFLSAFINPGDQIILKVGEEPTDSYGRLLAEVIRKSDGLNMNLSLVQAGRAVSYFISPIGNQETYQAIQDATKYAYTNHLGIWNTDVPLLELPFVFRARNQEKELNKYVGNSETKKYVKPENWDDVPVYDRVFFWTEEDAIKAGYQRSFNRDSVIADARYAPLGSTVTVKGTVIAKTVTDSKENYYIEDSTAGIVVRTTNLHASIGDEILAVGTTYNNVGLLTINATSSSISNDQANEVNPTLIKSTDIGEDYESQLVMLEDVTINAKDSENNYLAETTEGKFLIHSSDGLVTVGKTYDRIIGYLDYQYGAFKVVPRSKQDVLDVMNTIDIDDARSKNLGTNVKIAGIVTAKFTSGNKINYYVQDDTGAIVVRAENFGADLGDFIQAEAKTEDYYGLMELQPTNANVKIVAESVGLPSPKIVESNDLNESMEGQLVTIKNVKVTSVDSNHNYKGLDKEGYFVIDSDNDLIKVNQTYDKITGVVDYNYGEYKLRPRFADDIVINNEDEDNNDENIDTDIFGDYLDGDESLADVTDHIVKLNDQISSQKLATLLYDQLSDFVHTNGNTNQHIESAVFHIMTSLHKIDDHKYNEKNKIQHELEKLMKKQSKNHGKSKKWKYDDEDEHEDED